eukprot:361775-Chlamydomonas_euryale.AAC.21
MSRSLGLACVLQVAHHLGTYRVEQKRGTWHAWTTRKSGHEFGRSSRHERASRDMSSAGGPAGTNARAKSTGTNHTSRT